MTTQLDRPGLRPGSFCSIHDEQITGGARRGKKLRRIRLRFRNKSVVAEASDRTGIAIFTQHSTAPKRPTIILMRRMIACRREMLAGRM
jgi:hypothetical protein